MLPFKKNNLNYEEYADSRENTLDTSRDSNQNETLHMRGITNITKEILWMQLDQEAVIQSAIDAINDGDLNKLKEIISSIPESEVFKILSRPDYNGHTPLMQAIVKLDLTVAEFLSEQCRVDPVTDYFLERAPLSISEINRDFKILENLIESEENQHLFVGGKESPLYQACKNNDFTEVRYLIENGGDYNKSEYLSGGSGDHNKSPNLKLIRYLLECGADVNAKDKCGDTPLHICCRNGDLEIFKILVENGATNCKNNEGISQLQLSVLCYKKDIFDFYSKNSVHTREEILDCIELQGVTMCLEHDLTSCIRLWNSVLEERGGMKKSSFLENFQKKWENVQNYDPWIDEKENAYIHCMVIMGRVWGIRPYFITHYFFYIIYEISVLNIEFWEEMMNVASKCSDFTLLNACNHIFPENLKHHLEQHNFMNINSAVLNLAIRFIEVTIEAENSILAEKQFMMNDSDYNELDLIKSNYITVIMCLKSIEENSHFDFKWLHSSIKRLLYSKHGWFRNNFFHLMKCKDAFNFPERIVFKTFELFCKIADDLVNTLDDKKNTILHIALNSSGNDDFINVILKYGGLVHTKNEYGESITLRAAKYGREDLCTGPLTLQCSINENLIQKADENQEDFPSILKYYTKFH